MANDKDRQLLYNAATNDPAYWQALGLDPAAARGLSGQNTLEQQNPPRSEGQPASTQTPTEFTQVSPQPAPQINMEPMQNAEPEKNVSNLLQQFNQLKEPEEDALLKAQRQRRSDLAQLAMLQGANQIASAMAQGRGGRGGTPDLSAFRQLAEQKVSDVKEQRQEQVNMLKRQHAKMNLQRDISKNDPNSEESEAFRQAAMQALPEYENLVAGKSAKQIEDQLDMITKLKKAKQDTGLTGYQLARMEYLKDRLDEQKKNRELRQKKLEWQVEERDELSDKQTEGLNQLEESMLALDNLASQKTNIDTGPVASVRNRMAQALGVDDPEVSKFKASAIDTVASRIKALSGTAASDQERAFIMQTLPQMSDNDETFMAKLNEARKRLQKVYEKKVEGFTKQGKDPKGFRKKESTKRSIEESKKIKVRLPDGRVGNIPANKLQDAINRGAEVIQE